MRRLLYGCRMPAVLWAVILGASCADTEGTDPYGMWTVYRDRADDFTFRYLAPPWEIVEAADDADVIAAVEPTEAVLSGDVMTGSVQARFKAAVSLSDERAADAARTDEAALRASGARSVEVASLESGEGRPGVQLTAALPDRYVRAVYQDLPGGSVIMRLVGRERIGGADFTLMLRGVEPGAGEAAP